MRYITFFIVLLYLSVASSEETLTLTESGIKELGLEKGFNLGGIQRALPRYRVTKSANDNEILIKSGNELIITLHRLEKGLFNIEIHSNKVINSFGHNIGDTLHSIYGESLPHRDIEGSRLICAAPGSKKIIYIFTSDGIGVREEKLISIFWSYEWLGLLNN